MSNTTRHKIQIIIDSVPPPEETKPKGPSVEEQLADAIELIQSGHESVEEWELVRRVNNALMKKKHLSSREENILKMLQPTIKKYASQSRYKVEQDADKLIQIGAIWSHE